jgi:GSH-dependent disulfide-bond oxidoreductase
MKEITLFYNPTPNGNKPLLLLEELGLGYEIQYVDIQRGDQFEAWFEAVSANHRIPAITDHMPRDDSDGPIHVFESGAILLYLADKHQRFLPTPARARSEVMQWLFWQVGGLGPMAGQAHHFIHYAPERIDYAVQRYTAECARLYEVMDRRLNNRPFLGADYSIADMACWTWVLRHQRHQQDLGDFPSVKRWYEEISARPAACRTVEIAANYQGVSSTVDDRTREILFNPGTRKNR